MMRVQVSLLLHVLVLKRSSVRRSGIVGRTQVPEGRRR